MQRYRPRSTLPMRMAIVCAGPALSLAALKPAWADGSSVTTRLDLAQATTTPTLVAPPSAAPTAPPAAAPAAAAPAAPATVTLPTPGMAGSLAFSSNPYSIDVGPLGKWYVDGVLSGLGLVQSNPVARDETALADISNGQVIVQKTDGIVQFYAQVGAYSIPALGTQYNHLTSSSNALANYYSAVPQAFLKLAPTSNFSIEAGKLPTLIGAEYTFTFENFNIERGLLWNQEPAVSRGVQANYTLGPVAFSLSFNDGYYSDRFNWISGSATWTINSSNTLEFAAGGNLGQTGFSTIATPLAQNNSSIYNIIYTYNAAPFTITPYFQYSHVPANQSIGIIKSASSYGGAILANYAINDHWGLAGRLEYIATSGNGSNPTNTNLLYGAGSGAFSATITPTFTYNRFFARADLSVVDITNLVAGDGFGSNGNARTQVRSLLETGIIF
jgi:Putative beta-barrel porin-2, OmpL-like. bbp2